MILKLSFAFMRKNKLHGAITFLCIMLSSVLLSAVCGFMSTLLSFADKTDESYGTTLAMCAVVLVMISAAAVIIISSVFTVGFNERVNLLGLLATVGMTDRDKSLLVLCEAAVYGILGSLSGACLGFGFSELCAEAVNRGLAEMASKNPYYAGVYLPDLTFEIVYDGKLFVFSFLLCFFTSVAAAIKPMKRASKLSVINSLKADVSVNVSLREGFFERVFSYRFGRLGRLACQNFDNHGPRYRAVSLSLSCSAVIFITIYSMVMWNNWEDGIYNPFGDITVVAVMALGMALTFIALVGAASSAVANVNSRKREFAIFKSLGMSDGDMLRMMCFEGVIMAAHGAVFGLLGGFASVAAQYVILFTDRQVTRFHFPFGVWLAFLVIDGLFAMLFAAYAVHKIKRVNIAQTIK